ncbi:MAG: putative tail fiber protein [Candidatus Bathyarchaeota archaeon B24]|nr:MAG: putative tail fiber protein [Candidatus Bathyarchaeota archaeon B24]
MIGLAKEDARIRWSGVFKAELRRGGRLVKSYEARNVVCNVLLSQLRNALIGSGSVSEYTHIAVGSGTTTPTRSDTALANEIARKVCDERLISGTKVIYRVTFGSDEANGSINEVGVFDAASGGNMLARALFGETIEKTSDYILFVEYEVEISYA